MFKYRIKNISKLQWLAKRMTKLDPATKWGIAKSGGMYELSILIKGRRD